MSKITAQIIEQTKAYVFDILDKDLSKACVFHSWDHTMDVYNNSMIIGTESDFSIDDLNALAMSALFHDIGYVETYGGHEEVSVLMAKDYLAGLEIDPIYIERVVEAIEATKVPQSPKNLISKALCDADLMHLAKPDYFERMELLREEWKLTGRADLSETDFHQQSIVFFNFHTFHTKYGRKVLAVKKEAILNQIKAVLNV